MSAPQVGTALGELESLREDLDELTRLAGRVAIATRDGHAVDHETCVELFAHIAGALDSLDSAERYLGAADETESTVAS